MDLPRYVPCLRWKQGEYQAASRLSRQAREAIVPLIEVPEMGFDFETRENCKTVDEHLAMFSKRMSGNWGSAPCMVDLHLLDHGLRMANGDHPLTYVFSRLRAEGVMAVPVVASSFDRPQLKATKQTVGVDGRGVCVRVGIEEAASHELKRLIDSLLGESGASVTACDLVLDLGAPSFEPLDDFASLVEVLIEGFPYLKRWRSFTLMGTSFPSTLAGVPKGSTVLPRHEWRLYRLLLSRPPISKTRLPAFGDYGISHPGVIQGDMRLLKPSAAIRYTVTDGWLITKGTNLRAPGGHRQFPRLSQEIARSKHYTGPDFSAGDKRIAECASGMGGPGNLTTWRFVGTNHHLEKVVRDLATLPGL